MGEVNKIKKIILGFVISFVLSSCSKKTESCTINDKPVDCNALNNYKPPAYNPDYNSNPGTQIDVSPTTNPPVTQPTTTQVSYLCPTDLKNFNKDNTYTDTDNITWKANATPDSTAKYSSITLTPVKNNSSPYTIQCIYSNNLTITTTLNDPNIISCSSNSSNSSFGNVICSKKINN